MKNDRIIQFVCFITGLDFTAFAPQWEVYAGACKGETGHSLFKLEQDTKSKFKYISRHECSEDDFRFSFMKGRSSEHFPDQKVKVVQSGGYKSMLGEPIKRKKKEDLTLLALIDHQERDLDFYRNLVHSGVMNIYEAYFESCTYGYILEIHTTEKEAPSIISQLAGRNGVESAMYRHSMVASV